MGHLTLSCAPGPTSPADALPFPRGSRQPEGGCLSVRTGKALTAFLIGSCKVLEKTDPCPERRFSGRDCGLDVAERKAFERLVFEIEFVEQLRRRDGLEFPGLALRKSRCVANDIALPIDGLGLVAEACDALFQSGLLMCFARLFRISIFRAGSSVAMTGSSKGDGSRFKTSIKALLRR
jgi:hypothetical protein